METLTCVLAYNNAVQSPSDLALRHPMHSNARYICSKKETQQQNMIPPGNNKKVAPKKKPYGHIDVTIVNI